MEKEFTSLYFDNVDLVWFEQSNNLQLCPKCNGQGKVSKPPWIPGDVYEWSSTATSYICDICNGRKVV